jgi:integrase
MGRARTGSIFKREKRDKETGKPVISWWARLTFIDSITGRKRDLQRKAEGRAHARELVQALLTEFDASDGRAFLYENKTFLDLANYFREHFLVPARYVDGRKVAGLRSLPTVLGQLKVMEEHFGKRKLRQISNGDLRTFQAARLAAPARGGQRAIASVNRELALLRRMLNVAEAEGWILRSPFKLGRPLISLADERKRERILTRDEELRLLEACAGRRAHLRAIIICALDTGMRQGELLKLRWREVDLESGHILIAAFNTKTMRERSVQMTIRMRLELESLHERSPKDPEALVFGISDNVKNGFDGVRRAAGLEGVRFHDLRHTAATRLVRSHMPLEEVGRILGHTQPSTTYRYVNADMETARRAAAALDAFHAEAEAERASEPEGDPESVN